MRLGEPFTESDDAAIVERYRTHSTKEIAAYIDRSIRSVETRMRKLDLRRFDMKPFTPEEDEIIKSSRGRTSVEVSKQIGRSPGCVRGRARRLGLGDWKTWGGGLKEFRGYKVAKIERGDGNLSRRVTEHRVVMEKAIGRSLTDEERVHHINCRKRDNWIENLHLFATSTDHLKCHHSLNALVPELLDRGVIRFDRKNGVYVIAGPVVR